MEGWDFIVAGGGLFNNLDYSFVAGRENGTFVYPASQPGGGSPELRRQYGFLMQTMKRLDFIRMRPDKDFARAQLPAGVTARTLANPGKEYLVYVRSGLGDQKAGLKTTFADGELKLSLPLPEGKFIAEWLDPKTASKRNQVNLQGRAELGIPAFDQDIALFIRKK
jgi:hypothetical protein